MACEQWKDLLMGYLDNELDEKQKKQLQEHLKSCSECTAELEEFKKIKAITDEVTLAEPEDKIWQQYWGSIYNRIERGIGWILLSIAGIILITFCGFKTIEEIIYDPDIELIYKIGLLMLIAALAVLFISVLRERLFFWKRDRYKNIDK